MLLFVLLSGVSVAESSEDRTGECDGIWTPKECSTGPSTMTPKDSAAYFTARWKAEVQTAKSLAGWGIYVWERIVLSPDDVPFWVDDALWILDTRTVTVSYGGPRDCRIDGPNMLEGPPLDLMTCESSCVGWATRGPMSNQQRRKFGQSAQ